MRADNRRLLSQRWPDVLAWIEAGPAPREVVLVGGGPLATPRVDGIQLAGARDPRAEAELQAGLVPADAEAATVFGLGVGELPRVLLRRPGLEGLVVVVLSPAAAQATFAHVDHADWLADPRVSLATGAASDRVAPPFAAAPASLRLAADDCLALRDRVAAALAAPHVERHLRARDALLAARLVENRPLVEADGDVAELFDTCRGGRVFVAGAGPTLGRHLARLADRRGGEPLIAVDACLAPLARAGVRPDAVVSIEPQRDALLPYFELDLSPFDGVPLVYVPVVHADVLRRWPGPRLATYPRHPRYDALRRELPRGELWTSGGVIHPAVDLAVRMGAATVVLIGCDFAHVGGATHAQGSHYAEARRAHGFAVHALNGRGERVPSFPNLLAYLRDLEGYVALHGEVRFQSVDRDGARIEGVAYAEDAR